MKEFVRRSNLIVPATSAQASPSWLEGGAGSSNSPSWSHIPGAVTLDLEATIPKDFKREARSTIKDIIPVAASSSAEVLVRVNLPYLHADLEASVYPGIAGIVLPKVEFAEQVNSCSNIVEGLEQERGIEVGSTEILLQIESSLGVWNVREIVSESHRVTQAYLDERALCYDLGIIPVEEYDPCVYARGRVIVECIAAGVQPIGIPHPLGTMRVAVTRDEVLRQATVGKDLGFKGIVCHDPSWIEPVNLAFTPAHNLVEYYSQVRQVFAQAVAAGTAAVPFAGRMIDVPVDEWAKVVLGRAEACRLRDEVKQRAFESAS